MRYDSYLRTSFSPLAALVLFLAILAGIPAGAPAQPDDPEARARLEALSRQLAAEVDRQRGPIFQRLRAATTGPQARLNADPDIELMLVDQHGLPRFYVIENLISAETQSVDHLWPGGSSGLDLDGANSVGDLAEWDAGIALLTHQEFGGRVSVGDGTYSTHYHSTHVAGTLIASGVDPDARGMSGAGYLVCYDWSYDDSEMASAAAAGLLISNHSYGYVCGWYQSRSEPYDFYWYGDVDISEEEDPGFGYYGSNAQAYDQVAHDAPYYLIFKSAGNDRNDYGPDPGEGHYYWDPDLWEWVWSTQERPPDGGDTGYDTVGYTGNAKNIVTVAAVDDIPGGWTQPSDVVMSSFSNWGPTDDGRLKPDISANGIGLYSCVDSADDAYDTFNGTSMSGPSAAGAANLLAQQYKALNGGTPMFASALKGLIIHTADEAGTSDGPDYSFGWGLLNALTAAELVADDGATGSRIVQSSLTNGGSYTHEDYCDGTAPLKVTLCWTDPPGTPPPWSLDPPDPILVNDLDVRLYRLSDMAEFAPWILDPASPASPATTGDNFRDNLEQVEIATPSAGNYRVVVTHKGILGGPQIFSLIYSGFGGSAPTAPVVENVTFAQRTDGSGLVDIGFDLVDPDSPTVTVSLEASADGGSSWTLPITAVSGDVGAGVAVGAGKAAVWDFGTEHPGQFGTSYVIRVIADDGS